MGGDRGRHELSVESKDSIGSRKDRCHLINLTATQRMVHSCRGSAKSVYPE